MHNFHWITSFADRWNGNYFSIRRHKTRARAKLENFPVNSSSQNYFQMVVQNVHIQKTVPLSFSAWPDHWGIFRNNSKIILFPLFLHFTQQCMKIPSGNFLLFFLTDRKSIWMSIREIFSIVYQSNWVWNWPSLSCLSYSNWKIWKINPFSLRLLQVSSLGWKFWRKFLSCCCHVEFKVIPSRRFS